MFTDRFGSPLNIGDRVVVPAKTRYAGKGASTLRESKILGIVPLIPHCTQTEPKMERVYKRAQPPLSRGEWVKTGKIEGFYYMREDQQANAHPTEFYRDKECPQDKLFVIQYEWPVDSGQKRSFDRAEDVIKVPDGV